jgi:hypothetical protein
LLAKRTTRGVSDAPRRQLRQQAGSYRVKLVYLTHRGVSFASKPAPAGGVFVRMVYKRLYPSFTLR